ncbi:phosphoglucosamine mutase [Desulfobacterales bacterium HSG17]|nr:phosphoglucosamine mutase [Desulfobacterales bacterium HSG17]
MNKKYFGTDGIRGQANSFPLDPETCLVVGRAVARYFRNKSDGQNCSSGIIIGRDTRLSGGMIQAALMAGILSEGINVHRIGILPTPAVAYLTSKWNGVAGIMISASHNPFEDNGIKIFDSSGNKLSDDVENEIESLIHSIMSQDENRVDINKKTGKIIGNEYRAKEEYTDFLISCISRVDLKAIKIVADCANGAAYEIAAKLFDSLDLDVEWVGVDPDGININNRCGSEYPDLLAQKVLENKADLGLAFDGDADRMIAVDDKGNVVRGDHLIYVYAKYLKENEQLKGPVVTTVMSNLGLIRALESLGIEHVAADVGDRYVLASMKKNGANLGGEDSGHLIFWDHHTTGDGLLAALKLMEIIAVSGRSLSQLTDGIQKFPQVLKNIDVIEKPNLEDHPIISKAVNNAESELGKMGRVLVRYSGTQNLCRVMVEAENEKLLNNTLNCLVGVVQDEIGMKKV